MWSCRPLSGDDAALCGGRFNPKGEPALYLGLSPMTAIKEASQGLALKARPVSSFRASPPALIRISARARRPRYFL